MYLLMYFFTMNKSATEKIQNYEQMLIDILTALKFERRHVYHLYK